MILIHLKYLHCLYTASGALLRNPDTHGALFHPSEITMTLLPLPRAIAAQTRCATAIAAALMTLSGAAYAQQAAAPAETPNTLEAIQVSGDWLGSNSLSASVKTFPGARTVVNKSQIESTGAVNIGDVMRRIPGVRRPTTPVPPAARFRSTSACAA